MWKCPKCDSKNLSVEVRVMARLIQNDGVHNFETDIEGADHEWDGDCIMVCTDCWHADASRSFDTVEA